MKFRVTSLKSGKCDEKLLLMMMMTTVNALEGDRSEWSKERKNLKSESEGE